MAALEQRDVCLGWAGDGLEPLQQHKVPSSGAVRGAGQYEQRD